MLTEQWTPLRYHTIQSALWRTKKRIVAVWAGRGSGKTELAKRRVVRLLPVRKHWAHPMYFYALPTRPQAKRVAWEDIKALVPPRWLKGEPNETEMRIDTIFGSSLYCVGMDRPQRIEGNQWDGGVFDESSDQRPGAFAKSIMPALSHRNGWCWRIGVPKRTGRGAAEFRAFCEFAASGKDSETGAYTWPSSDILTPDQLRWARENNDPKDYAEQYEASWEDIGGLVFYAFDERLHVDNEVAYDASQPLLVSCDFNVDPMAWVICQRGQNTSNDSLLVLDEIHMRNSHTQLALDALFARYATHSLNQAVGWDFFGDATSRARKTSAPSTTDYLLIKSDKRFRARTWFPKANPSRRTRFAETNAMFKNAEGVQRIRIHPRCRNLIADLKQRSYIEGTSEPDDHNDIGHITDALGYVIHRLFPIKLAGLSSAGRVYLGKI